jgi:hypothetical protein
LGEGAVISSWDVVAENPFHDGFEVGGVLATGVVDPVDEAHGHFLAVVKCLLINNTDSGYSYFQEK